VREHRKIDHKEMEMGTTVDARGLSCPQPVLMTMDEIKKGSQGEIIVLVDTDASKENVARAAASKGWKVKEFLEEDLSYRITLEKKGRS
jgi:tRNA 2-thiouridine synthesizing protein A